MRELNKSGHYPLRIRIQVHLQVSLKIKILKLPHTLKILQTQTLKTQEKYKMAKPVNPVKFRDKPDPKIKTQTEPRAKVTEVGETKVITKQDIPLEDTTLGLVH